MPEDDSSHPPERQERRSWLDRIGTMLSGEPTTREDLVELLRDTQADGLIAADTLRMMEGAIAVSERTVGDVMIPRAQLVALAADASLLQLMKQVVESGHSRFPVHGEDKDEILGILLAKDLLRFFGAAEQFDIRAILRPAVLIPESMRLNVLLEEFRLSRNHMALVVNEYGGVAGLITIEDVLEQIVGEIDDEHDDEEEPELMHEQPGGDWLVSALTPIEDFNEQTGAGFPDEEYDTVGGMVTAEFGHLPEVGEEVAMGDYLFHVTAADDRRVQQFRVVRQPGLLAS
jgi:magnesium and cobalt transporter